MLCKYTQHNMRIIKKESKLKILILFQNILRYNRYFVKMISTKYNIANSSNTNVY